MSSPAGLKPIPCPGGETPKPGCGVEGIAGENVGLAGNRGPVECPEGASLPQTITCAFAGSYEPLKGKVFPKNLAPYDQIELRIAVDVQAPREGAELKTS